MTESNTITVTIKFFANLREYGPKKSEELFPKGSIIKTILEKYKIPKEEKNLIIMVNGRPHQKTNRVLANNDIVAVFPPIGGG